MWKMPPIISKSKIQQRKKVLIVFNDMVADVTSNKKLHPVVIELIQYFGFKYTVIVPWTKRCKTKYYIFLYHEDPPKSKRFNKLLLIIYWYWLQRLHGVIQKMYCKRYWFLVIVTTLPSDIVLRFQKICWKEFRELS